MKKLFEVSIRGSLYFYLSTISEQQVSQLQQFANQFYRSNSAYKYRADDEIMECFTISVKQKSHNMLAKFRHLQSVGFLYMQPLPWFQTP